MTSFTRTLLLLETRMTGHRPSYLRRMTQMALKNGMKVVIAMPSPCFKHPVAKSLMASGGVNSVQAIHCQRLVDQTQATNIVGMIAREFDCAAFYREALQKAKLSYQIDVIIISTFDDAAMGSGLRLPDFGNTPWIGIVMKQRFHFSAIGAVGPNHSKTLLLKRWLFIRLLRRLKKPSLILTIDESLSQYIASAYPEVKDRIAYIPDPVDERRDITKPDLRADLGIPEDAFVILAYGSLRERKGVPPLLDALHELPQNVHALLVGTQAPEIVASVNSQKHKSLLETGRVHQVNRYIDVSEDPNFFVPADMVWIAYENYFAMSAVMVQAAQYQRPTIATRNGLVGFLTNKYQTGILVDNTDKEELHCAIIKLMNKEFCPSTSNYDAFSKDFSLSAFEDTLLRSINSIDTEQVSFDSCGS